MTTTDDRKPTALELLAGASDILPDRFEDDPTVLAELAFVLAAEGVYEDLDDHDGRHAAAATLVALIDGGPEKLRAWADWIASGESEQPLHNPAAVVTALRRTADIAQ